MTILVHNTQFARMERFEREKTEPMPYADATLLVGEFQGSSKSELMWTTTQAMESWKAFRRLWGEPIYVPYAFKRIGEGGHAAQSQHYAGTAFDCAQNLTNERRAQMRLLAVRSGLWTYVEPVAISPTWVHLDRRINPPACATGGYPLMRRGCVGVYVCVLQDALNVAANAGLVIDGRFGYVTEDRVRAFQSRYGYWTDGIGGCDTWRALTTRAVGAY